MNWYKQSKIMSKKEVLEKAEGKWEDYVKFAIIEVLSFEDAKELNIIDKDGTLKTIEGPQKPTKNDVICKGLEGELWNQPKSRLEKKYTKLTHNNENNPTNIEWESWKPNGEKVEAFRFTKGSFKIDSMTGKKGDWILRDKKNKSDVWIVNNNLFHKTYKKI